MADMHWQGPGVSSRIQIEIQQKIWFDLVHVLFIVAEPCAWSRSFEIEESTNVYCEIEINGFEVVEERYTVE